MENFLKEAINHVLLYLPKIVAGLLVFFGFWLASAFLQKTIRHVSERAEPGKGDVLILIGQAAKVGLIIFGAVSALGTMGINVSALVAGLGLTGFALGFALRDALSNLLAGLLILVYRPFQRDSQISVAGFEGTVVEIDLRYTTLQAKDKKILIPNATLFTNPISLLEATKSSEENLLPKAMKSITPERESKLDQAKEELC